MQITNARGETTEVGPRTRTTIDAAFDDATAGLHGLGLVDCGDRLGFIPPADAEDQIRELYATKRQELASLGAPLNATDFYRPLRSVKDEAAA
jgi:hypothetical protein